MLGLKSCSTAWPHTQFYIVLEITLGASVSLPVESHLGFQLAASAFLSPRSPLPHSLPGKPSLEAQVGALAVPAHTQGTGAPAFQPLLAQLTVTLLDSKTPQNNSKPSSPAGRGESGAPILPSTIKPLDGLQSRTWENVSLVSQSAVPSPDTPRPLGLVP